MIPEPPRTLLITHADYLVTMDAQDRILRDASLMIAGNRIAAVGAAPATADEVLDARGLIVLPGTINCHHHLFQAFLRHVPEMQNQRIDKWVAIVSRLGRAMDPEAHYHAALANMAELLFSGCTTTTDMTYLYPPNHDPGALFAAGVRAAARLGIRFHPYRGGMTMSKKDGAQYDDDLVESPAELAGRAADAIRAYHNPARDALLKVGLAPTAIYTNRAEDYRAAADLAGKYDVNLQTHLSESVFEQQYARQACGCTPLAYLQDLGWQGRHVSFVHGLELDAADLARLRDSGSTLCHCPISNARQPVGQRGIAPIAECLAAGINVAIGVDGSAGNDSSNMLEEMRWARTLQGAREQSTYLPALDVLRMATIGGARGLRWDDALGSLEAGKCADLALFDVAGSLGHVGAWHPVGSLLSCQALRAHTVIVNGRPIIREGRLLTIDEGELVQAARASWRATFADLPGAAPG